MSKVRGRKKTGSPAAQNGLTDVMVHKRGGKTQVRVAPGQYRATPKDWKPENIKNEDTALSLLLGFQPDAFKKFCDLSDKTQTDDDQKKTTTDDRVFHQDFRSFLASEYGLGPIDWQTIIGFCMEAKKRTSWSGDFASYIQTLHDEGFIFKWRTYESLKLRNIEPKYSHDGWARTFYRGWIQQGE